VLLGTSQHIILVHGTSSVEPPCDIKDQSLSAKHVLQYVAVAHRPFNDIWLVVFCPFCWDDPLDVVIFLGTCWNQKPAIIGGNLQSGSELNVESWALQRTHSYHILGTIGAYLHFLPWFLQQMDLKDLIESFIPQLEVARARKLHQAAGHPWP